MQNKYDSADAEKQEARNVIIICDDGGVLYGHDTLKRIVLSKRTRECHIARGVRIECYIGFLSTISRLQHHLCVQLLRDAKTVTAEMLERISDTVEITPEDLEEIRKVQKSVLP